MNEQELHSLDIKQILALLPHRYPFLMVDRIVSFDLGPGPESGPGARIKTYKNVSINEHFFQGHFPGEPIMPGVLILEGLAQTGALLAFLATGKEIAGKLVYFVGIDGVKFRRKVVPGDQLVYELTLIKRRGRFWITAGKAHVDGALAAEAQLMATFADLS